MRFASLSQLHKRLGVRLVFWYALFFTITALAVASISYRYLSSSLRDNRTSIQARLAALRMAGEAGGAAAVENAVGRRRAASRKSIFFIRVLDSDRRVVFLSEPRFWRVFDLESFDAQQPQAGWQYVASKKDGDVLELTSTQLKNGYWLQVGKTIEDRKEILEHYRDTIIGVISGMILLGVAGGAFLASRALRPIRRLTQATQAIIATGRMDARVPESGVGDELDKLTGLFNKMLERIQSLITNMREALDNVAHDLRTPLTRIRGEAEVALQHEASDAQRQDALASNIEESDRLLALLNSLMDIAEAESGSLRLQIEPVRLRKLLDEVVELYEYSAEDAQVSVGVACSQDITIVVDRARFRQVLANLLDNAIKYSAPGSKVAIDCEQTDAYARISFHDEGIGIPPEETSKVWDRLYRGDKSRSQTGLGLGLSIVRAVVHAHGGEVQVRSALGKGSTFEISLARERTA